MVEVVEEVDLLRDGDELLCAHCGRLQPGRLAAMQGRGTAATSDVVGLDGIRRPQIRPNPS